MVHKIQVPNLEIGPPMRQSQYGTGCPCPSKNETKCVHNFSSYKHARRLGHNSFEK